MDQRPRGAYNAPEKANTYQTCTKAQDTPTHDPSDTKRTKLKKPILEKVPQKGER